MTVVRDILIEPLAELMRLRTLADLAGAAGLVVLALSLAATLQQFAGVTP